MPVLLRIIAQRVITSLIAFLTFLGLAPDATIPTNSEVDFRIEEQKRIVEQILELRSTEISPRGYEKENIISAIDNAAATINQKKEELENNPPVQDSLENSPVINAPTVNNSQNTVSDVPEDIEVAVPSEGQMKSISDVLVNIICTQKVGNMTKASTGSGVIISPTGVVITNAHVAQFFLLEDSGSGSVDCAIYKENIPTFGYRADLIYISPIWIEDNKEIMLEENPRGTGEKDYAFLQITENTNPVLKLPSKFSYTPVMTEESIYTEGRRISVGGFPGSPLSIFDLAKAGSLKTDNTRIRDVFTILGETIDIFSTEKTPVAAKGASGGGVFYNNNLIGVTVTVTKEGNGARINAITTDYINRDLADEAGFNLNTIINNGASAIRIDFQKNKLENLANSIYQNI
jgi:hypothetical protein